MLYPTVFPRFQGLSTISQLIDPTPDLVPLLYDLIFLVTNKFVPSVLLGKEKVIDRQKVYRLTNLSDPSSETSLCDV